MGFTIICSSCENKPEHLDFINYDEKGVLKIDIGKLEKSGLKIESVQFVKRTKIKQGLNLDSTFRIKAIYSIKESMYTKENHMNNWLAIDYDGNLDLERSYFYEAIMYESDNNQILADIHFQTSKYKDGKPYILYGNISENFSLIGQPDTAYFKDGIGTFPVLNTKEGRNEKRFILVDESKRDAKGKTRRRYILGTLTFDR